MNKPTDIESAIAVLSHLHFAVMELGRVGFDRKSMDQTAYAAWVELNNAQKEAGEYLIKYRDKAIEQGKHERKRREWHVRTKAQLSKDNPKPQANNKRKRASQ